MEGSLFWADAFVCPNIFLCHEGDSVEADLTPGPGEYNEEEYDTLISEPAPFRRYPKAFLCSEGLSRHYSFSEEQYPTYRFNRQGLYSVPTSLCCLFSFYVDYFSVFMHR